MNPSGNPFILLRYKGYHGSIIHSLDRIFHSKLQGNTWDEIMSNIYNFPEVKDTELKLFINVLNCVQAALVILKIKPGHDNYQKTRTKVLLEAKRLFNYVNERYKYVHLTTDIIPIFDGIEFQVIEGKDMDDLLSSAIKSVRENK